MHTLERGLALLALFAAGCAQYFPGPVHPLPESRQSQRMVVQDDGTVSYVQDRLELSLRPLSDAELNRAFPEQSFRGAASTNPYTYGNWTPLGEERTPPRFAVFLLKVKNYAYPKVRVNPVEVALRSESGRVYKALTFLELSEYYRAHALAWAGNAYRKYSEQRDALKRTLYEEKMVFSGQEDQGYIVFPPLAEDVTQFSVTLKDVALRFNYADEPVEILELNYGFAREVYRGFQPPALSAKGQ
ncbi:MAG: hypothetical protein HYW07_17485 [Candidatus Latescibacteria bacterium]|nr:hypothetical protein [Candidatus Latescibacterota bacterium]